MASGEHAGQHEEHVAPAETVAEDAAGGLAEQLAEDLPGRKRPSTVLAPLIGHDVADKGHAERDDPAGGEAAGEAARATSCGSDCASAAEQHQHAATAAQAIATAGIFAEAVADRADHELHRAVGHSIGGDDDRGGADADAEVGGDLRQQRIGRRAPRAWLAKAASASSAMARRRCRAVAGGD